MNVLTVTVNPSFDRVLSGDELRPDGVMRTRVILEYAGGKGNNAARALARLGAEVTATGFQGGNTGRTAVRDLQSEGIATEFVCSREPTRVSTLIYEESSCKTYGVYEPGQEISCSEIHELDVLFRRILPKHKLLILSGSAQSEKLANLYYDFSKEAAAQHIPVLLDSSGPALRKGIQAIPDLVKVNRQELEELVGERLPEVEKQKQALGDILAKGISMAAMTDGSKGMLLCVDQEAFWGSLAVSHVINSVGCGDSVLAGFALSWLNLMKIEDMLRFAIACGAANTQVRGAGYIDRETVEQYVDRVTLARV